MLLDFFFFSSFSFPRGEFEISFEGLRRVRGDEYATDEGGFLRDPFYIFQRDISGTFIP